MKLTVISHKEVWRDPAAPSGYSTYGGFPLQMQAISEAFDETVLAVPLFSGPPPSGLLPITGHNLRVLPLTPSYGVGIRRQLAVVAHLPKLVPTLLRALDETDAVHAVVPGDIGTLGVVLALARRTPLFVRHCGTWGATRTPTERFLMYLLERYAGGRNVVMATGGAPEPPSATNDSVEWIFSSSLRADEIRDVVLATPWRPELPLRLVTVSRLDPGKNVGATIEAVASLRRDGLDVRLTVVGDGSMAATWKDQAREHGLDQVIDFPGRVGHEAVLEILARSHVFVFPTNVAEGFPKAVLEAMACGLPIIATRVSVIPELLKSGAGVVLDETTPLAVERALRRVIASPEALPAMGAAARKTSLEFTLERWRDTIAERCTRAWSMPTRDATSRLPEHAR